MRRFAYNELGQDNPVIVDEEEIRRTYWDYWNKQMRDAIERGSPNVSDADLTWDRCLEDFLVVNWAWEVDANGQPLNGVDHHAV